MTETMSKTFKHPLARKATTTKLRARDGAEQEILVIITTLELDIGAKGYSAGNVERLHEAARAFLAETAELGGYVLVNRPKEWDR
jgi:hypothetical protein